MSALAVRLEFESRHELAELRKIAEGGATDLY
jgi:hypothetical protein